MIRPTVAQDIIDLANNVREEDAQEIESLTGLDVLSALSYGLFKAEECVTGIGKNGAVVLVAGVHPSGVEGEGLVWMICTEDIRHNVRELLVSGREWLDGLHARYSSLTNAVEDRFKEGRILLRHLGFTFREPFETELGPVVHPFERKK